MLRLQGRTLLRLVPAAAALLLTTGCGAGSPVALHRPRPHPPSPLPGPIFICDGKANRILEVGPSKHILWEMTGIEDPDDVQVYAPHRLVVNQEDGHRVVIIDTRTKRVIWSYGHLNHPGSGPGYLNLPDDSYHLPNGNILIDDANNQRVIQVSPGGQVVWQFGHTGVPGTLAGYLIGPNDAVPQADGTFLITNVGNPRIPGSASVEEVTVQKQVLWRLPLPLAYPSDALLEPGHRLLVADWVKPGAVFLFGSHGQVLWEYRPQGPQALNHPSSAQLLPNGDVLICDDRNDRILVVKPTGPRSGRVVWQYGHTGLASTAPGYLDDPSGVALAQPMLSPEGSAPRGAAKG